MVVWILALVQQDFSAMAEKVQERVQAAAATVRELREKKLVHADALAEVDAYLAEIKRQESELRDKAKKLSEGQIAIAARKREFQTAKADMEAAEQEYKAAKSRLDAHREDMRRRREQNDREIADHNAKKGQAQTQDEVNRYNDNAARLNRVKDALSAEVNTFNNVELVNCNQLGDKWDQKSSTFNRVEEEYNDMVTAQERQEAAFKRVIDNLTGPIEELSGILQKATQPPGPPAPFRTFDRPHDATLQLFAETYGGKIDLHPDIASRLWVLASSRGVQTLREYLVEKLRFGQMIERFRAFQSGSIDRVAPADRAVEAGAAALSDHCKKPCALVKGTWTLTVPRPDRPRTVPAPNLRE